MNLLIKLTIILVCLAVVLWSLVLFLNAAFPPPDTC